MINKPIIYCNDAFCELTGYSRSDIIQKPCTCEFLYGNETGERSIKQIRHALQGSEEKEVEIILYKNTGMLISIFDKKRKYISVKSFFYHPGIKFQCSILIAPVKNESCDIILFILEFTESTVTNRNRRIRMYYFVSFYQRLIISI